MTRTKMSKVVFISYSHDSETHKAWVKKFADDLSALGNLEILLDQNMPKGFSFTRFMEIGLARADKVLVIGTPQYREKAENGRGVAFEESIISAELMKDIDTTKYYPILRVGTFETSFPPALQGRNGDDMTDDAQYEVVLKGIAEAILHEKPLPSVFTNPTKVSPTSPPTVATVHFGVFHTIETYNGRPTSNNMWLSFRVTVTNTAKEHRYYNEPLFKLSKPIEDSANAFYLPNILDTNKYPFKLEFGQQFTASYKIDSQNAKMLLRLLSEDHSLAIKAVVNTTLGEMVESAPLSLDRFKMDLEHLIHI